MKLTGKTKLPESTPFYIFKIINNESIPLANSSIKNGKIEIEITNVIENELLYFVIKNNYETYETQFLSENAELEYDEKKFLIKGGKENQLYYEFASNANFQLRKISRSIYNKIYKINEEKDEINNQGAFYEWYPKAKIVAKELNQYINQLKLFISKNPKAIYSYIAIENLYKNNALTIDEIIEFNKILMANFPYKSLIIDFDKIISKNKLLLIGEKIPNHIFFDINNKEIELNKALGKVTLIDFWSTKCKSCRAENDNLYAIYKKYHKKGFNIIRINTDANTPFLNKIIEKNQLEWINISKTDPNNKVIDSIYRINNIPSSFLLDSTGKIIAKNIVDEELKDKIKEILK